MAVKSIYIMPQGQQDVNHVSVLMYYVYICRKTTAGTINLYLTHPAAGIKDRMWGQRGGDGEGEMLNPFMTRNNRVML